MKTRDFRKENNLLFDQTKVKFVLVVALKITVKISHNNTQLILLPKRGEQPCEIPVYAIRRA